MSCSIRVGAIEILVEGVGLSVGETLDPLGAGVAVIELLGVELGVSVGETLELFGVGRGR